MACRMWKWPMREGIVWGRFAEPLRWACGSLPFPAAADSLARGRAGAHFRQDGVAR
jgi:hypothetical protein